MVWPSLEKTPPSSLSYKKLLLRAHYTKISLFDADFKSILGLFYAPVCPI